MSNHLGKAVAMVSALFTLASFCGNMAQATESSAEAIHPDELSVDPLSQITPVWQLSDIQPTDWQFQVLESLDQRYGCLAEYPDRGDRTNRTLTRSEFAARLQVCLNHIPKKVRELAELQGLIKGFAAELARRRDSIERLERIDIKPFDPTTTLQGEVLFAISYLAGKTQADGSEEDIDPTFTVGNKISLDIDTSFTGEDRLRVSLEAKNAPEFEDVTGTEMARLDLDGQDENELELDKVEYRFSLGKNAKVYISAKGGGLGTPTRKVNLAPNAAISKFGDGNPIYDLGGDAGVGWLYELGEIATFSLGYAADDANELDSGIGAEYGAIAQLTLNPNDNLGIAFAYVHSYNIIDTGTGSDRANDPFDDQSDHIKANSYALDISVRLSPKLILGGWMGWTQATALNLPGDPQADIFNYALTLAFPDLGKPGNLGGMVIGQPPKVINNTFQIEDQDYNDKDTAWHLEVFYTLRANDNISITPGLLIIFNPEHDFSHDLIYVGTILTIFSF